MGKVCAKGASIGDMGEHDMDDCNAFETSWACSKDPATNGGKCDAGGAQCGDNGPCTLGYEPNTERCLCGAWYCAPGQVCLRGFDGTAGWSTSAAGADPCVDPANPFPASASYAPTHSPTDTPHPSPAPAP